MTEETQGFESDGCTMFLELGHHQCCVEHDLAYYEGADRLIADVDLFTCVAPISGPVIALLMFIAVRVFGKYFYDRARKDDPDGQEKDSEL